MQKLLTILFVFTIVCSYLPAQTDSTQAVKPKPIELSGDTLKPIDIDKVIQNQKVINKKFVMKKSPTKALIYSLLLPGTGQIYVENYWKAPIFMGGSAALVYSIYFYNHEYSNYQSQYDAIKQSDPTNSSLFLLSREKEFYRDNRDMSAFYLLVVYIFSAVDAYVGAHLYDFNVSDDLSFKLNIDPRIYQTQLSLKYNF